MKAKTTLGFFPSVVFLTNKTIINFFVMMNKILNGLFIAMMFASMCACSSDDVQQSAQVENSLVSFSFFDASIEAFNVQTRADDKPTKTWKDFFSRLDIAIFPVDDINGGKIYRFHQLSSETGFGSLALRLPFGKYKMVAVASKAKSEVDLSSPEIAVFPDSAATDMAYVYQEINVKSGATSVNCMLKRALTKFNLESSDSITKDVSKVEIKFTGFFSHRFNPTTGFGIKGEKESSYVKSWTFTDTSRPKGIVGLGFFMFIPQEEATLMVDANVYDNQGNAIRTLHFDNVKLQQNHVTTYKGPLFTSGSTLKFDFDNKALGASSYDTTFGD